MTNFPGSPGKPEITVQKVRNIRELNLAQKIRYQVFVMGQGVPEDEEIDKFEERSTHFLAYVDRTACGAARWRTTEDGVKLERFAVLPDFRRIGVGSALVEAVLDDIANHTNTNDKPLYLHAQVDAVKLYSNYGFRKIGELFQECNIDHYKMVR